MHILTPSKPREQLYLSGEATLTLEQAVALVLGSGVAGHPVFEVSRGVAQLLRQGKTTREALATVPGMGPAKVAAVLGALSLAPLAAKHNLSDKLQSPESVYEACADFIQEPKEHLVVFFLNVRSNVLCRELVSIGTATSSIVHAREVFRAAIVQNAHSVILAHNHPSGDPTPSQADLTVTQAMARAGSCIGIELLDHVICARGGWYSLKQTHPELFR